MKILKLVAIASLLVLMFALFGTALHLPNQTAIFPTIVPVSAQPEVQRGAWLAENVTYWQYGAEVAAEIWNNTCTAVNPTYNYEIWNETFTGSKYLTTGGLNINDGGKPYAWRDSSGHSVDIIWSWSNESINTGQSYEDKTYVDVLGTGYMTAYSYYDNLTTGQPSSYVPYNNLLVLSNSSGVSTSSPVGSTWSESNPVSGYKWRILSCYNATLRVGDYVEVTPIAWPVTNESILRGTSQWCEVTGMTISAGLAKALNITYVENSVSSWAPSVVRVAGHTDNDIIGNGWSSCSNSCSPGYIQTLGSSVGYGTTFVSGYVNSVVGPYGSSFSTVNTTSISRKTGAMSWSLYSPVLENTIYEVDRTDFIGIQYTTLTSVCPSFRLWMEGDIFRDGYIGGVDISLIGAALFTSQGQSAYSGRCDLFGNGYIGGIDISTAGANLFTSSGTSW